MTLLPFIENKQLSRKLCFENKQMEEHEFSMTEESKGTHTKKEKEMQSNHELINHLYYRTPLTILLPK